MPFTLSHTAVVLPLFRWRRLDPLALVVGSMAPGLRVFLPSLCRRPSSSGSRFAFWRSFLTAPLPWPFRDGVRGFLRSGPWTPAMIGSVPFSLLSGIATHSLVDAFTHRSAWFVKRLDFLHDPWPVYHVLQHLGSVLGMLVLASLAWRSWKAKPDNRVVWEPAAKVIMLAMAVSLFLAIVLAWNFASRFDGYLQLRVFAFRWVVHSIALSVCAYLLVALCLRIRHRIRPY